MRLLHLQSEHSAMVGILARKVRHHKNDQDIQSLGTLDRRDKYLHVNPSQRGTTMHAQLGCHDCRMSVQGRSHI